MADPISVGTALGLIGTVFNLGRATKDFLDSINGVPTIVLEISRDIDGLSLVLHQLDEHIQEAQTQRQHGFRRVLNMLPPLLQNCSDCMKQLKTIVETYLEPAKKGRLSRWQRFSFAFKESRLKPVQTRLGHCKTSLSLAIQMCNYNDTTRTRRMIGGMRRRLGFDEETIEAQTVTEEADSEQHIIMQRFLEDVEDTLTVVDHEEGASQDTAQESLVLALSALSIQASSITQSMPPTTTISPTNALKAEPIDEENLEREHIGDSQRSDRSLNARVESARRACNVHKRRTGRSLDVPEQNVINAESEMYGEEDDELPLQYQRPNWMDPRSFTNPRKPPVPIQKSQVTTTGISPLTDSANLWKSFQSVSQSASTWLPNCRLEIFRRDDLDYLSPNFMFDTLKNSDVNNPQQLLCRLFLPSLTTLYDLRWKIYSVTQVVPLNIFYLRKSTRNSNSKIKKPGTVEWVDLSRDPLWSSDRTKTLHVCGVSSQDQLFVVARNALRLRVRNAIDGTSFFIPFQNTHDLRPRAPYEILRNVEEVQYSISKVIGPLATGERRQLLYGGLELYEFLYIDSDHECEQFQFRHDDRIEMRVWKPSVAPISNQL